MSACPEPHELAAFASATQRELPLDAHLDDCLACRRALIALAQVTTERLPSIGPARRVVGDRVGRYELRREVGRGGMGIVYEAFDPTLRRTVALKLIRPAGLATDEQAKQLLAEAQAMARVVHPEVLPVYDAGTVDDEVYIAMEWVHGTTLRAWLAQRPRGWSEVLAIFIRAGRGLAATHRAGLLHRDFKPDNVLLGDDGRVRVGDFGLAHPLAEAHLSLLGGTAPYLAPELLREDPPTPASDQFAFCVALVEALSRRRPAGRDEAQRLLAPIALPASLTQAILRGLEQEPARRHPTMDSLLAALEPPAPRSRRRAWTLWLAPLLALGVWGLAWHFSRADCGRGPALFARRWSVERKAALLQTRGAGAPALAEQLDSFGQRWAAMFQETCEATHVSRVQSPALLELRAACLEERLTAVDALVSSLEGGAELAKATSAMSEVTPLARCADLAYLTSRTPERLTAEERATVATLRQRLAGLRQRLMLEPARQVRDEVERALAQARRLGVKAVEGEALLLWVQVLRELRSSPADTPAIDAALEEAVLAATEARHVHGAAEAWLEALKVRTADGRFEEAHKAEKSVAANLRALGSDPWLEARHAIGEGSLKMRTGQPAAAMEAFERGSERLSRLAPAEALLLAPELRAGQGLARIMQGELHLAVDALTKAVDEATARDGRQHPKLAELHHNLGDLEVYRGRLEAASAHLEEAAELWTRTYGPDNPRLAANELSRARLLAARGDFEAAEGALSTAERLITSHHLEGTFLFVHHRCTMAELELRQGAPRRAIKAAQEALGKEALGAFPIDAATCELTLAEALMAVGRGEAARGSLDRAGRLLERAQAGGVWVAKRELLAGLLAIEGGDTSEENQQRIRRACEVLEKNHCEPGARQRARLALEQFAQRSKR